MRSLRQLVALTSFGLRSIPARLGASLVTVIGIMTVVAVLVSLLSMGEGAQFWETGQSRADRAVVLSRAEFSAFSSRITRDEIAVLSHEPGVKKDADGNPLVTAGSMVGVDVVTKANERGTLYLVGITNHHVYPEIHVLAGHWPRAGLHELAVSKVAQRLDRGVEIGDRIALRGSEWTIVGVFEDAKGVFEQVLFGDGETVLSAFGRDAYQQLTVMLDTPAAFPRFKQAVLADPSLKVDVYTEAANREKTFTGLRGLLDFVSYFIGTLMAMGAICAALSSLYASVDARGREIATLRALGFSAVPVLASVLIEGMLLALGSAVAGALIAWLVFNGKIISTEGLTFPLAVSPHIVLVSIIWALAIGLGGALLPAIRAARVPVAFAMRET
ncbi:MAG TPA: FtsX-like permease family protein [Steroidobacteraceae bacterium]|nr:FtsX-like permease family protein [Steroidobacteraceae bacterium]